MTLSFRALLAIPVLGALAMAALHLVLGGGEDSWLRAQAVLHGLGFVGCVAAAAALARRDWMFRAWSLYAVAFGLQAIWRFATGPVPDPTVAAPQPVIGLAYLVVLNVVAVTGSVMFVLAFRRSGLAIPGSRARAAVEIGTVALIAFALGVPALVVTLRHAGGPPDVLRALTWVLGDVLCFALVAPLWRISRAFAGGALAWPWGFLAVCNLGYLAYDAAIVIGDTFGWQGPDTLVRVASETLYAASSLCALSAGLAHRRAVTAARAATERPA